ncbi:hypothetical protein A2V56_01830 [Candidatus Woesebacteria bacterium RBG_19FT_COMBO_42_9]|uniref:Uncharacterized protein n=1 Tax=Candidatus Woesebacteria bacterium RBG_16_42_24 TaxID=1802485 RepID=A0A1F7XJR5_9BACT|nr:MAG: hypothetical protein A2V97_01455 [Candidatus Woesebacteria bacterium RBG_16_42_24]OGM17562.1 MAG: hypothetical protein A2V56_01830 [Candidatus Woesebacteria bacterium RBG_19FT_COMBO_42_9]OGM67635.1 MAG: hypothetical protein A2985_00555 [Candidatus Woesebacteria bacterium RIFCSPLOWO2_01_FULL_43_11]
MTHVSRKKLAPHTEKVLQEFIKAAFYKLDGSETFKILNTLLSETEIAMLKKRAGIILLLELGYSPEEVAGTIKTTRQTISRFRLQTKLVPEGDKNLLMRKLKLTFAKELTKDFLKNLDLSKRSLLKKITPF